MSTQLMTTSVGSYGYTTASPPSGGGGMSSTTSYDSTRYTNIASDDSLYAYGLSGVNGYSAHILEFEVPAGIDISTVTQIDGVAKGTGFADAGDPGSFSGIRPFMYNNNTSAWATQGGTTGTSKTFTITTNPTYYINSTSRKLRMLVLTYFYGDNECGTGAYLHMQYASITITYTGATGIPMNYQIDFYNNSHNIGVF